MQCRGFIRSKAQLLALQKKFKADALIGAEFGISRQAVHQMRVKFGVPAIKDKFAKRNEAIYKAYSRGVEVSSLAVKYRRSTSQLYRILKRYK